MLFQQCEQQIFEVMFEYFETTLCILSIDEGENGCYLPLQFSINGTVSNGFETRISIFALAHFSIKINLQLR